MRRCGGRESWHRLREWDKGQSESERLAARLLPSDGYEGINPSHPLGGPDGGEDIRCKKEGKECIVAVYFPRGQKAFREIIEKYKVDLHKAITQQVSVFVFFTNQELSLGERHELENLSHSLSSDIYHLERIASALDAPKSYGLRLEFLSIEMTKEEQVSFFNERDQVLYELLDRMKKISDKKKDKKGIATVFVEQLHQDLPLSTILNSKLMECKNCGEIFRAERSMFPSLTAFSGTLETVTCPSCGKVQAYR